MASKQESDYMQDVAKNVLGLSSLVPGFPKMAVSDQSLWSPAKEGGWEEITPEGWDKMTGPEQVAWQSGFEAGQKKEQKDTSRKIEGATRKLDSLAADLNLAYLELGDQVPL